MIANRCIWRIIFAALAVVWSLPPLVTAESPKPGNEEEKQREQQLASMQNAAAQYKLSLPNTPELAFKLHEAPAMRFSNPITGTKDGALFVWTDQGRPQALLKFFTFNGKIFSHAWLSLSENKFVAERQGKVVWSPAKPGIEWRLVPDAPRPAETPVERLRQMKTVAARFHATYTATHLGKKPFELRILPQPLFRYATNDEQSADGALFGYVQSTTPIALLLLESRSTQDGLRWHYAYSSLVTGPVSARYGDKEIFSLERDAASTDPEQPFILFRSMPVSKE